MLKVTCLPTKKPVYRASTNQHMARPLVYNNGHYTSDSGSANQSGTFEPQHGAISCSGVTQPGYSPSGSMECLSGTYAPNSAMGECILSTPGNHVPSASEQIPCPPGFYQPDAAKDSCIPTDQGYISVEGASQQSACQPGTYQSRLCHSAMTQTLVTTSPLGGSSRCRARQGSIKATS